MEQPVYNIRYRKMQISNYLLKMKVKISFFYKVVSEMYTICIHGCIVVYLITPRNFANIVSYDSVIILKREKELAT